MLNNKGAIQLIILGSIIVVVGVLMYLNNISGSIGLIIIGGLAEALGLAYYFLNKKK